MGWDGTGRNITRKCPKCNGKLEQFEGFHSVPGGGYYKYSCKVCNRWYETENVFSLYCRGKLKET